MCPRWILPKKFEHYNIIVCLIYSIIQKHEHENGHVGTSLFRNKLLWGLVNCFELDCFKVKCPIFIWRIGLRSNTRIRAMSGRHMYEGKFEIWDNELVVGRRSASLRKYWRHIKYFLSIGCNNSRFNLRMSFIISSWNVPSH